jgi:hypothetical protein
MRIGIRIRIGIGIEIGIGIGIGIGVERKWTLRSAPFRRLSLGLVQIYNLV